MFGILKRWLHKKSKPAASIDKPKQKWHPAGPKTIIQGKGIKLETQMHIREKTEVEQRIWKLNKQATELKGVDWDTAITCLAEAQKMRPHVPTKYTIAEYLRLPVFLQQAGRMAEAEVEFKKLLSQFDRAHEIQAIYDKMRMAYQREKRFDEAAVFGVMELAYGFIEGEASWERFMQRHEENLSRYQQQIAKYKNEPKFRKRYEERLAAQPAEYKKQQEYAVTNMANRRAMLAANITKLLKKAKKEGCLEDLLQYFHAFLVTCTPIAAKKLGKQVTACLQDARVE